MTKHSLFSYFKTSPEIIRLAVMLYVRFLLSLRNVEDLLHCRSLPHLITVLCAVALRLSVRWGYLLVLRGLIIPSCSHGPLYFRGLRPN